MREEAKMYGMEYSPYPPYEILKTNLVSYEEMIKLKKVEEMVDKYYNSQKFNYIIKFFEKKFNTPFEFYYALGKFFEENGYFNRNIGNIEYYKVFLEFNKKILKSDNKYLDNIVKFNYLLYNKRRGLPNFLKINISKEEEKKYKDKLREKYSFKEYFLEKFDINLEKYVKNGELIEEDFYCLFNNNNEYLFIEKLSDL